MEEILDFFRRLHDNNDREWFDAHRNEWSRVRDLVAGLAGSLIDGISSFDPSVAGLRPRDCSYRIARDTRFSADKSPYKNWLGIFVAPQGKQSGYAGYYLHIAPCGDRLVGRHMLISGLHCPEPKVLRSVREEVLDNGDDLLRAIPEGFELYRANSLKRTPQGFPPGTAHDDLLRLKEFWIGRPVDDDFLLADDFVGRAVEMFRATHPFVEQLNRAVRYAREEM